MGAMKSMPGFTRRGFARSFGAALLLSVFRPERSNAARLRWESEPAAQSAVQRRYRADAQVVLLSFPVLSRSGVGGGSVRWAETADVRLLEFDGYSLPERAAGLRRLGVIRELARTGADGCESIYFGLMTASPEESAEEARRALRSQEQMVVYTTIAGRVAPGDVETTTAHFTASSHVSPAQYEDLMRMAWQALSSEAPKPPELDPRSAGVRTFLHALAGLLEDESARETRYIYNGRSYRLSLRRSPDPKAAAYFSGKSLISPDAGVARCEGKLRREPGGKEQSFQVWIESPAARPLPLRIEYQPKSYLRLTFEAERA
jgi:hypothetical protein